MDIHRLFITKSTGYPHFRRALEHVAAEISGLIEISIIGMVEISIIGMVEISIIGMVEITGRPGRDHETQRLRRMEPS